MIKKIFIATGVAAALAVVGSMIHPFGAPGAGRSSQTILGEARIDPETLAILQRACQNCHSQQTVWPWYSHVAPVSWLLARDVQQARVHMNLSRWQDYSTDDRLRLLSSIGSAVRNREMPVQRYLLLHPEARLTDAERQQIYHWTRTERNRLRVRSVPPLNLTGEILRHTLVPSAGMGSNGGSQKAHLRSAAADLSLAVSPAST